MRKSIAILIFAVSLLATPLLLTAAVYAADFRSGESVGLAKGEVVDSTLFIAGQSVEVAGEVKGDLYCAGNTVTVTGTVHGDVLCAGQTVNIRGIVDGDIRAAGEIVTIEAQVAGNVSVAGQNVTLSADASARDVHGAGSIITLNGKITRDVDIAGDKLNVNGMVGRNVRAAGENVSLGSKATIAGNLEYQSHQQLSKAEGATVAGTTRHQTPDRDQQKNDMSQFSAGMKWFFALTTLLTSLVLVAFAPRFLYSVSERGRQQPLLSVVGGLGVSVGGIVLAVLLAFTLVGLSLAGIVFFSWLLLLIVSVPVFSFCLGRALLARVTNNAIYYMLAGAVVTIVVSLLPLVGPLCLLIATWSGVGMLTLEFIRRWPKPQYTLKPSPKKS